MGVAWVRGYNLFFPGFLCFFGIVLTYKKSEEDLEVLVM